jgi:putative Ca2+/H+ antiporter (TMEM165/GDT1 family)
MDVVANASVAPIQIAKVDFFPVHLPNIISIDWFTPISTTYALIVVAEMGDKSQLVCMTLAARHRAKPVM